MKITSVSTKYCDMNGDISPDVLEKLAYDSILNDVHFSYEGENYKIDGEVNFWDPIMLPNDKIVTLSAGEITPAVASLVPDQMLKERDFKNMRFRWKNKTYMIKGTELVDLIQLPDGTFLSPGGWMGLSPMNIHETKFVKTN